MKTHGKAELVDFPSLAWAVVEGGGAAGRTKMKVVEDGRSVRILELSPKWNEPDWCIRAHAGYVTSGKLRLEFAGQAPMEARRGTGFWIPSGCAHKATCNRTTTLFLVD